jgi:hypothetical protein
MTEPRKIARYGWIPDLPDECDHGDRLPLQAAGTRSDRGRIQLFDRELRQ